MENKYRNILTHTLMTVAVVGAALLSSCSVDDADGYVSPNAPVSVSLSVSAGAIGDLNYTRAGNDANADEHEFMHTLYVYIVDDNTRRIELALNNPINGQNDAATGDCYNYTKQDIELTPGAKTIYAFSNMEGYEGTDGTTSYPDAKECIASFFPAPAEGAEYGTVSENVGNLDAFRLVDPAAGISHDGKYIPMSAKTHVTVTSNTREISVGLTRLVSKVRLTIGDNSNISQNATLTFSGYSTNVPLMRSDEVNNYNETEYNAYYGDRTRSCTKSVSGNIVFFYVNETLATGNGFTVTLNTGSTSNGDISEYRAVTNRKDLPRNSVYPLSLTFPEYSPAFLWKSWEAHIGEVPVEVVVDEENYIVNIAAGNTFKFTVTGIDGQENVTLGNVEWRYGDVSTQITDITNDGATLSGAVTAGLSQGVQIPLTVTIEWTGDITVDGTSQNRSFERTYNVIINTISIWDTEPLTRSFYGGVNYLAPEFLNMFKLK